MRAGSSREPAPSNPIVAPPWENTQPHAHAAPPYDTKCNTAHVHPLCARTGLINQYYRENTPSREVVRWAVEEEMATEMWLKNTGKVCQTRSLDQPAFEQTILYPVAEVFLGKMYTMQRKGHLFYTYILSILDQVLNELCSQAQCSTSIMIPACSCTCTTSSSPLTHLQPPQPPLRDSTHHARRFATL